MGYTWGMNNNNTAILTGSPKQVAWADRIRANVIAQLDELGAKMNAAPKLAPGTREVFEAVTAAIANGDGRYGSAAWWIDNRLTTGGALLREAAREHLAKTGAKA